MTKTYNTQDEIDADIKDGVLKYEGDIKITFDCVLAASIDADNIKARNIDAWDIKAWDINAMNIDAEDIDAWDINAMNIDARNIDARNIDARNIDAYNIDADSINAWDINAMNIDAEDISYYAYCIAYEILKCKSIKGRRANAIHACLDAPIEIIVATQALGGRNE